MEERILLLRKQLNALKMHPFSYNVLQYMPTLLLNCCLFCIMTLYSLVSECTTNLEAYATCCFSGDGMHLLATWCCNTEEHNTNFHLRENFIFSMLLLFSKIRIF
jgi:hypothetical protein